MALRKGKKDGKRFIVEYVIQGYYLYEHNTETDFKRKYDLFSANDDLEKLVFKTRLSTNYKRDYNIHLSVKDLIILKRIGWL